MKKSSNYSSSLYCFPHLPASGDVTALTEPLSTFYQVPERYLIGGTGCDVLPPSDREPDLPLCVILCFSFIPQKFTLVAPEDQLS